MTSLMLHFGITPALLATSKAAAQLIFHSHQQWLQQNHLHDNETYRAKENQ
jgi:hypothetical protein